MKRPSANAYAYCCSVRCDRAPQLRAAISAESAKAMSCNPDSGFTATAECTGHIAPTVRVAALTAKRIPGAASAAGIATVPLIRVAVSITTGSTRRRSQPRETATPPSRPPAITAAVRAVAATPLNTPGSTKIWAHAPRTIT